MIQWIATNGNLQSGGKMDFRLAIMQDLPQLKAVYKDIVRNMNENQIEIWDDIYPCEFFEKDINNQQLYVLYDDNELVSAFALCDTNSGEKSVKWKDNASKALYLDRLGVNVNYSGKGIGSFMLTKAREVAKTLGAEYLRLFVVDINKPAIRLYTKNGFTKATGIYDEIIDIDFILHEYGYEVLL
jgi:ribosomal protein S18 acetylase RimI-like enzyme